MIKLATMLRRVVGLFMIVSAIILIAYFALTLSNAVLVEANGPLSSLDVVVPDYEVTAIEGEDYVEIPDGMLLLVEGEPRVPYYTVSIDYPGGYVVQDVLLTDRSGMVTDTGLNIPTVTMIPGFSTDIDSSPLGDGEGWYPGEDYEWRTFGNLDGSTTLVILMYPFYYEPQSTDVRFYKNYSFDIEYVNSTVEITSLTTQRYVYLPGETVTFDMELTNSGQAQDVIVSGLIREYGSDEIVDGLQLSTLHDVTGDTSFSPQWDSTSFKPGHYYVEVELKDAVGNLMDSETESFGLRESWGEITSFTATPEYFDIGDSIDISLAFENTGKVSVSGTAIIILEGVDLGIMEEFQHEFSDLAPSKSVTFHDTWDTAGAGQGTYHISGEVMYGDEAAGPLSVSVSSGPPPLTVTDVSPGSGNQGDMLEITITGTDFTGAATVSLGSGISVNSLNISSPTQITAGVRISTDATVGTRDVSVSIPEGTTTLEDSFAVHGTTTEAPLSIWIWVGIGLGVVLLGIVISLYIIRYRRRSDAPDIQ